MMLQEPNTVQRKSKGVVLLLATLSLILSSCAKYDDEDPEVAEEIVFTVTCPKSIFEEVPKAQNPAIPLPLYFEKNKISLDISQQLWYNCYIK
jgi:hypothetical protein